MADAPAPPDPQADSVTFAHFSGLRNTIDPERLSPQELARARNIDLDDADEAHRRRGYRQVVAGIFHSLFTTFEGKTVAVKDGVLSLINPDYSTVSLLSGVGPEPLAYAQVGETLYFSSRVVSGQLNLRTNVVTPWGQTGGNGVWFSPVVNPQPTLPAIRGRLFGAPPLATSLAYFNGRIYLASQTTLWATELYLYNFVDKTKDYKFFESEITAIGVVTDGIYIGTKSTLWFLNGTFLEMVRQRVLDVGVLPGTMVQVPAELVHPQVRLNPEQPVQVKPAVMFVTTAGVCVGLDGGQVFNVSESRFLFPDAVRGAAMFRRQDGINSFVSTLDSQGTPQATARLGDHLTAELIRGPGVRL
jgi:hypothetical protein